MTDAPERMAGLARPMQHALNNSFMILQVNLDSVAAGLPPEDKAAVRMGRALQGLKDMEALLRGYFRLGRPHEEGEVDSGRFLEAVRPVLALAAKKPLKVEVRSTAMVKPNRPEADLALLDLVMPAQEMPHGAPLLVLDGKTLIVNWQPPEGAEASLRAAGLGIERGENETRISLG
ncbi:hypothetical protein ACFOD4_07765 [Pseudoroseomonas globiformis]|uniref:Signal transduction histidine kinase dimerisation/phosphoacceptor domain-containing protein n=1 Tax=Teichococcus globiformis TaxID=2307229 RepID=A0ABV7FX58_9PROT